MYYYFASTLPMIEFDGPMPFSVEDFQNDCERLLTNRDYARMRAVFNGDESPVRSAAFARWEAFERALTNETVRIRAQQAGRNPAAEMRGDPGFDAGALQTAAQAFKTDNLLEAQKAFLRAEWDKLDEISLNKEFSLDAILAYGLKLKILERLNTYKTDEGSKKLEEMMGKASG